MALKLDVPVEFGGVSIGLETVRLGVAISRQSLNINAADELFTNHRLTGRIVIGGADDQPGQTTLVSDFMDAIFDVKGLHVTSKKLGISLTFSRADLDDSEIAKFAKQSGRLQISEVGAIPKDAPKEETAETDDDADADDEDGYLAGMLATDTPWREVEASELFDGSLLKALLHANLQTLGALHDATGGDAAKLAALPGIGPGKADKIARRVAKFFADNPDALGEDEVIDGEFTVSPDGAANGQLVDRKTVTPAAMDALASMAGEALAPAAAEDDDDDLPSEV